MFEDEINELEKMYEDRAKELKSSILNQNSALYYLNDLVNSYNELHKVEYKLSSLRFKKEQKEETHD